MAEDIGLTWIEALIARGISIEARGTRIAVRPKSAYSTVMTEDERRVMKDHRAEIVALLNDTYEGTAEAAPPSPPEPTATEEPTSSPEAEPEPPPTCQYCDQTITGCAEMKTARPDVWSVVHHQHPDVIEERRQRATAEMMHQIGKPSPFL